MDLFDPDYLDLKEFLSKDCQYEIDVKLPAQN